MSKKIPFLQMFAALCQWQELAEAVEGWVIVAAAIDKASRSALVTLDGARGAGANLIRQAEEAVARCCGLASVKFQMAAPEPEPPAEAPAPAAPSVPASAPQTRPAHPRQGRARHRRWTPSRGRRPFGGRRCGRPGGARRRPDPREKGRASPPARRFSGMSSRSGPPPSGELELDMGMVVIEGDVFAVDNRELKKRGAWVVAFDLTDYTGSIRVNKFFPGDEGKPIVDGVKKGMHLQIQGRLNMDRFYGDMVLEPMSIMAVPKPMKMDDAPEKRVELHLHTTMSAMDALTSVGPKLGPDKNAVKRAEAWGHRAIAITDHGVAQSFPDAWHSAKNIKILYGVEAYYINDVDDRVVVHGETEQPFDQEIVCFDIETTGLNRKYEVIIEIGAVVLKNGEITDRFNTFVSPAAS